MPKRGIDYVKDVISYLARDGFKNEVPGSKLRRAISVCVSFDAATISKYVRMMIDLEIISSIGGGLYRINLGEVLKLEAV